MSRIMVKVWIGVTASFEVVKVRIMVKVLMREGFNSF